VDAAPSFYRERQFAVRIPARRSAPSCCRHLAAATLVLHGKATALLPII
jgi:hypothetical protein